MFGTGDGDAAVARNEAGKAATEGTERDETLQDFEDVYFVILGGWTVWRRYRLKRMR
jgi:hypothetical protein